MAPLTNEANTLISACAKRTSNSQLPLALTSRSRNVAPPSIYAPRLFSRAARSSALIPSLPPSLALSLTQHAPRFEHSLGPMQPLVSAPPTYTVRKLHVRYLYLPTCGSRAWQDGGRRQDRKSQVHYSVRHQPVCGAPRRQSQGPRLVLFSRHRLHARRNPHTFKRRPPLMQPEIRTRLVFCTRGAPPAPLSACERTHEVFDASCRVRAAVHPSICHDSSFVACLRRHRLNGRKRLGPAVHRQRCLVLC